MKKLFSIKSVFSTTFFLIAIVFFSTVRLVWGFTGPSTSTPGAGSGAIGVDASNNISVGTSTTKPETKFLVVASSTDTSNFALKVINPSQGPILFVRNDGSIGVATSGLSYTFNVSGTIYASGNVLCGGSCGSGSIPASNITAGVFNGTGTANYAFPNSLGVGTTSQTGLPSALFVLGTSTFLGNVGIGTTTSSDSFVIYGAAATFKIIADAPPQISIQPISGGTDTKILFNLKSGSAAGSVGFDNSRTAMELTNMMSGASSSAALIIVATSGVGISTSSLFGPNILFPLDVNGPARAIYGVIPATGGLLPAITAEVFPGPTAYAIGIGYPYASSSGGVVGQTGLTYVGYLGLPQDNTTSGLVIWSGAGSQTSIIFLSNLNNAVGIGTTQPSSTLHVVGNLMVSGSGQATTTNLSITGLAGASGCLSVSATGKVTTSTCSGGGGITSLNGLSVSSQTFATSSGAGYDITSAGSVHTFKIPAGIIQIATIATTTGNLIVGDSSAGWIGRAVGANGRVLTASSTAQGGVSWEPAASSISASGVTAGVFNGGPSANYAFPNSLGVNTSTNNNLPANLAVYGTGWFSGLLDLSAATLKLPLDVNLTAAGNVAVMTTSSTLEFSDGTNVHALDPLRQVQWIIENPTASEDDAIFIFNVTSTIKKLFAVNKSTGDTATFNVVWDASRATAAASSRHLFSSNQVEISTTTADLYTSFASSTVNANSVMRFITSAASSSQFTMTLYYEENP